MKRIAAAATAVIVLAACTNTTRQIVAGGVMTGVGTVASAGGGAGLGIMAERNIELSRPLIVFTAIGAAILIGGAIMVGLGIATRVEQATPHAAERLSSTSTTAAIPKVRTSTRAQRKVFRPPPP